MIHTSPLGESIGSPPESEVNMFGLASALRVLLGITQWILVGEVGLGQMGRER